jgi:hypothetical protein
MFGELLPERKNDLTVAIAHGASLRKWAEANGVPKTTAYRWADEPEVQACANAIRRRALERGVGLLSRRVAWAARGIVKLAESADSEPVRLSALRAIYSEMIAASRFGALEHRMCELEERARDDARDAG